MDSEKKEFGGWWMWILLLTVATMIVIGVLHAFGMIGGTIVERKVFENSFQYSEARKAEIATYEASLAEIQQKLNGQLDESTRQNLEAQKSALRIRLSVARSKAQ